MYTDNCSKECLEKIDRLFFDEEFKKEFIEKLGQQRDKLLFSFDKDKAKPINFNA